jgi:hypothetical protein
MLARASLSLHGARVDLTVNFCRISGDFSLFTTPAPNWIFQSRENGDLWQGKNFFHNFASILRDFCVTFERTTRVAMARLRVATVIALKRTRF